jgi:hypothetical protein
MIASRPACRRRLPTIALAAAVAIFAGVFDGEAQRGSRDRSMYVSAIDKSTRKPVESLTPDDVVVREDGVSREVLRVTKATDPMQIAVLVDNSQAADPHVVHLRDGLKAFVQALAPQHELSIVTYGDRPTVAANFSKRRDEALEAVARIFALPNAGAYMLDAIRETAAQFTKRRAARPVMVVVGTEGVEFSNAGYEQVLDDLERSGAQLHVLHLVDTAPDTTQEERYRSIVVDRGTRESGGRRENLLASMSLPDTLKLLAEELNNQFRVVYARPDSLIPPREVTIVSTRPSLEVRGILARAETGARR